MVIRGDCQTHSRSKLYLLADNDMALIYEMGWNSVPTHTSRASSIGLEQLPHILQELSKLPRLIQLVNGTPNIFPIQAWSALYDCSPRLATRQRQLVGACAMYLHSPF